MSSLRNRAAVKPSLALIGLRGSGKTAVGRALITLLGGQPDELVDTDESIVRRTGRSIADIFDAEGEVAFRAHERDAIEQLVKKPPRIIALGGGAILDPANVRSIKDVATVIWLTASVDVLQRRVAGDPATTASRPSLTNLPTDDEIRHLAAAREPHYRSAADMTIDTTDRSVEEVAKAIVAELGLHCP